MYLYVYLNIFKAGFPGIRVWNILLNFTHVCRWDYLWLKTGIMCVFCQLIISLLGVFCVRCGGVIVKILTAWVYVWKRALSSCKYLLISICAKSWWMCLWKIQRIKVFVLSIDRSCLTLCGKPQGGWAVSGPPVYHRPSITVCAARTFPQPCSHTNASAPSLWSAEQRCFLLSGGDVTSENQVAIISGTAHPEARSNSLGFVKEQFPGLSLEFTLQML